MAIKNSLGINSLEFNTTLTKALDKAIVEKSVTGFMADNALRQKFVGAKTVLIPEVNMSALADYDRDTGFTRGAISVSNTPFVLQMDRGRSFQLDAEDQDETGLGDLIGQVSGEFVRTKVVPEVDAYCLSKIGGLAVNEGQTVTGTPATQAYAMLMEAAGKVYNYAGYDEELVAFVDSTFWAALQNTPEVSRQLVVNDFAKGNISTKVKSLNGISILPVPDSRMKSAYEWLSGEEEGNEGGFAPTGEAKSIGFIVMPKRAASLVKKTEKTRLFNPSENLNADAFLLQYRVYYDLFVKNSMKPTIYAYVY